MLPSALIVGAVLVVLALGAIVTLVALVALADTRIADLLDE